MVALASLTGFYIRESFIEPTFEHFMLSAMLALILVLDYIDSIQPRFSSPFLLQPADPSDQDLYDQVQSDVDNLLDQDQK